MDEIKGKQYIPERVYGKSAHNYNHALNIKKKGVIMYNYTNFKRRR